MSNMVIGLIGYAGAGKDYTANVIKELVASDNVKIYKFAEPLKAFCRKVFNWTEDHTDGDLKEVPDDHGVVPRIAMQKLGAEWGRELYNNVWVDYTLREIWRDMNNNEIKRTSMGWKNNTVDIAIITDVRFPNEAKCIHDMGGYLFYVDGGKTSTPYSTHSSETSIDRTKELADVYVDNTVRNREMLRVQLHTWLYGKVALR